MKANFKNIQIYNMLKFRYFPQNLCKGKIEISDISLYNLIWANFLTVKRIVQSSHVIRKINLRNKISSFVFFLKIFLKRKKKKEKEIKVPLYFRMKITSQRLCRQWVKEKMISFYLLRNEKKKKKKNIVWKVRLKKNIVWKVH